MLLATALLAAAVSGQSLPPWGTGQSRPEDLRVSVVTFSPGDTLTEWWGHTALVVEDTRLNHARLYNYGMFGFSTGFVHKFVQGRLEFWVEDAPVELTYQFYARHLKRDVRIQELDLLPEQATAVAKALADNVLPQNREYLYHHYNDNCSTRPRDMVDIAFGGQLKAATDKPSRTTLRYLTRRYSRVSPPMLLVLDYLQNDELDRPITQQNDAFLPDELEAQLDALRVKRPDGTTVPAVKRKWEYFKSNREPPPEKAPDWTLQLIALGLALGGLSVGLARWGRGGRRLPRVLLGLTNALLGLVLGAFGLFLFVVGLWTNHTVAHRNENLLLVSPVTFAALPLGLMLVFGARRAKAGLRWTWTILAATSVLAVLVKVLPAFDQNNWNLIALFLPMNVGFAAAAWLEHRRWAPTAPAPAQRP